VQYCAIRAAADQPAHRWPEHLVIGNDEGQPQRYTDQQILGDAKHRIIAKDPAQHHNRHNDCDTIDNRLRHGALLLRAIAAPAPTISAPSRSNTMNTSKLSRCWAVSRAI